MIPSRTPFQVLMKDYESIMGNEMKIINVSSIKPHPQNDKIMIQRKIFVRELKV